MKVISADDKSATSLSDSAQLRYITFILLYFSQGIPEGLTLFAIPAWLAFNGKSAVEIAAYSATIMIPFSLKILLAPIIEKYTYLPMGRRRPWLLFGQFGIMSGLIALAFVPEPLNNIFVIICVVLCMHVFVMFQDIATDSLVIDIVPVDQQGRANSLMWGSKTIGSSVSLFLGSWLINEYGFASAFVILSVPILVVMFVPLLLRERKGEKLLPWTHGQTSDEAKQFVVESWKKMFKSFKQVVLLRNSILLLSSVFIALAAIYFINTLLPIFTIQKLGWTNVYFSKIFSSCRLIGGVSGMLVGALVIQRMGVIRFIQSSLILMIVIAILFVMGAPFWHHLNMIIGFITTFCILATLINIGVLALAMQLCWKRVSAIQFTFCMTIFNAGLATGAALLGWLKPYMAWQQLFLVFACLIAFTMLLFKFMKTSNHVKQVEKLEDQYIDVLKAEGGLLVKSETV